LNNIHNTMDPIEKYIDPLTRTDKNKLRLETSAARRSPLIKGILEAVEDPLLVLNSHRQILLANDKALETLRQEDDTETIGRRPGEVFECIHSDESPGGCSGSRACLDCGALQAVITARRNERPETRECLLTLHYKSGIRVAEFRVRAAPFRIKQHEFTTVLFQDISAEKRRDVLEQIFFHDVMNTIGGLKGWSETFILKKGSTRERAARQVVALSDQLIGEILNQKLLLEAERGDLTLSSRSHRIDEVYELVINVLSQNSLSKDRTLEILPDDDQETIFVDLSLLGRVMINLVINALEATPAGGTVKVRHSHSDGSVVFQVWNSGAIPKNIARHIFQRSFSTKADKGRGIGTYCTRLLVERYLKGRVTFRSSPEEGTTFIIELPDIR
jgi:signal transduction histidine kinase